MNGINLDIWIEVAGSLLGYEGLRSLDVLFLEKELAIEVGEINCVEVNLSCQGEGRVQRSALEKQSNATRCN